MMTLGKLYIMAPLLWQYLRYLWKEANFSFTATTLDPLKQTEVLPKRQDWHNLLLLLPLVTSWHSKTPQLRPRARGVTNSDGTD